MDTLTREELETMFRAVCHAEQTDASVRADRIAHFREVISGIEIPGDMDWYFDEQAAAAPYPFCVKQRRTSAVDALRETHRQISDAAHNGDKLDLKRFRIAMRTARIAVLRAERGRRDAGCAPSEAFASWIGVNAHLAATMLVGYAVWAGIPGTYRVAMRRVSALSLLASPTHRLASVAT